MQDVRDSPIIPCYSLVMTIDFDGYICEPGKELRTNEDPIARLLVKFFHLALMFLSLVGQVFRQRAISTGVRFMALLKTLCHHVAMLVSASTKREIVFVFLINLVCILK